MTNFHSQVPPWGSRSESPLAIYLHSLKGQCKWVKWKLTYTSNILISTKRSFVPYGNIFLKCYSRNMWSVIHETIYYTASWDTTLIFVNYLHDRENSLRGLAFQDRVELCLAKSLPLVQSFLRVIVTLQVSPRGSYCWQEGMHCRCFFLFFSGGGEGGYRLVRIGK